MDVSSADADVSSADAKYGKTNMKHSSFCLGGRGVGGTEINKTHMKQSFWEGAEIRQNPYETRPKQLLGQRQLLTTGTTIYTRY